MYQFVFGFINITDVSIDVEWQVCTTLLVSQLSPFASDLICVYALIIGLLLTSKSQNMIIILEWQKWQKWILRSTANVNDHTYKLRKPSFTASAPVPECWSMRNLVRNQPATGSSSISE